MTSPTMLVRPSCASSEHFVYPSGMQGRRRTAVFLAPLAAGLGAALLCLSGPGLLAGFRLYDFLLGLRRPPDCPREVLLLEMGESTGPREWDGLGIAEGLATMAELGARYAVFPSPGTLDSGGGGRAAGADLSSAIDEEFTRIDENVAALFDAIRLGSVPPKESPRFVAELLGTIEEGKARLLDEARGASQADRARLEAALRLFGRAYFAVDPFSAIPSRRSLPVEGARGRGSSRFLVDPDGAWRRVALVPGREGGRLEHVAFVALLDRLGGPSRALSAGSISIRGAALRAPERDIVVPLSRGGLLLDWPRPRTALPRRLAWSELARAALLEEELVLALDDMDKAGFLASGGGSLPGLYDYAAGLGQQALAKGEASVEWLEARERFFELTDRYLKSGAEAQLYAAGEPRIAPSGPVEEATLRRLSVAATRETIDAAFAGARETNEELGRLRARLRRELESSFCIVAPVAAGSEGRKTPFGETATEGLASAAIVGSILSGRFLRELDPVLGSGLGAFLSLVVAFVASRKRAKGALIAGAALSIAGAGSVIALFLVAGAYISPIAPAVGPAAAGAVAWLVARRERRTEGATSQPPPAAGR
jgi:hypothetical protein